MPVGAGRDQPCAGLCWSLPVATGTDWCRPMPTGAGADRNPGVIARNAVKESKSSSLKSFKFNFTFSSLIKTKLDYEFYSKSYDFVPLPLQRYRDSPSATVTNRYGPFITVTERY